MSYEYRHASDEDLSVSHDRSIVDKYWYSKISRYASRNAVSQVSYSELKKLFQSGMKDSIEVYYAMIVDLLNCGILKDSTEGNRGILAMDLPLIDLEKFFDLDADLCHRSSCNTEGKIDMYDITTKLINICVEIAYASYVHLNKNFLVKFLLDERTKITVTGYSLQFFMEILDARQKAIIINKITNHNILFEYISKIPTDQDTKYMIDLCEKRLSVLIDKIALDENYDALFNNVSPAMKDLQILMYRTRKPTRYSLTTMYETAEEKEHRLKRTANAQCGNCKGNQ